MKQHPNPNGIEAAPDLLHSVAPLKRIAVKAATAPLIAAALTACGSLPQARMALPDTLGGANTIAIDGVGGKASGQFQLGESRGTFSRSATQLSLFDTAVRDRASTRFEISGEGWQGTLVADCGLREVRVEGMALSIPVLPLKYSCGFNAGGDAQGTLVLAQAMGSITTPTPRREGTVAYLGTVLNIRAEYGLSGTPLKLSRPSGYRFERGGLNAGTTVAAVEVTDTSRPTVYFADGLSERERRAAILGALALGLVWEPEQ